MNRDAYFRTKIVRANQLAKQLKKAGSPIMGFESAQLWNYLSSDYLPSSIGFKLYKKAGYKPFEGFPLVRI